MKKLQLLLLLLFTGISLANAQEKSFIVNKSFEKTISLVSDFQSSLMKDEGGFDASMGDNSFKTDLIIRKEKYSAGTGNNYLIVKNQSNKADVILSSTWDVTIEKLEANKSKVSLSLLKIDSEGKSHIDVNKTVSSGKLEKQLKGYITSKK